MGLLQGSAPGPQRVEQEAFVAVSRQAVFLGGGWPPGRRITPVSDLGEDAHGILAEVIKERSSWLGSSGYQVL